MDFVFLGINFPEPRNYERVRVENVNFNENLAVLIERFREITGIKDEVSLSYLGNILEDNEPMNRWLRGGSTIHVLKKVTEEEPKDYKKFTELDVSRVTSLFRSLNSGNFHKISRTEMMKTIFDAHPEIKKDVLAMSMLRDPILLSNLQNPDTVRKLAQTHRVLIEASETIVKTLKTAKSLPEPPAPTQPNIDDFSDSSSSSGSESNMPQASGSNNRRITSEYLRQSLAAAAQGRNSLNNISQRNLSQAGGISPSTSSASVPAGQRFISSSMFMNAMNEVLLSNRRSAPAANPDAPEDLTISQEPTAVEVPVQSESAEVDEEEDEARMEEDRSAQETRDIEMITSFQTQLRQMEELGLRNKAANIQALMVCNGNLEAAVNLVMVETYNDMQ